MSEHNWSTAQTLKTQLQKRWDKGQILAADLTDEPLFPLKLRFKKPTSKVITQQFSAVVAWIKQLQHDAQRYGFTIHWRERNHRIYGKNQLPDAVTVDHRDIALRWLGKQQEANAFAELTQTTLTDFPELADWLSHKPLKALSLRQQWPSLLTVLRFFQQHPRPNCYLRELDIPGIHTKFIERHRGLLAELLDLILPSAAIDSTATGVKAFNRRYGLLDKPTRARFRVLDSQHAINGLTDISAPITELAQLNPDITTVFITENEINGLAFPNYPKAWVFFGLGYSVHQLHQLSWLHNKRIIYWGDIDTHGLAILNRFRHYFAQTQSMLMDIDTLNAHQTFWGQEAPNERFTGNLDQLTAKEQQLYTQLRDNQLAKNLRLEQEQIRQQWLLAALEEI